MQQAEIEQKAQAALERATTNEAKQHILFNWHRKQRPTQCNVLCQASEYAIYQKAVTELNEQYSSSIFVVRAFDLNLTTRK